MVCKMPWDHTARPPLAVCVCLCVCVCVCECVCVCVPMATRGRWDRQLRRRQPPTRPPRSWTVSPEFLCLRRGRAVMLLCVAKSARLMCICDGKSGPRPRRGAQAKAVHAGTLSKKAEDRGGQKKRAREGGRKRGRGREREREGGRGGAPHTHHAHAKHKHLKP